MISMVQSLITVSLFVLAGNQICIAETVRSLGKPSLQILSLIAIPVNYSHITYTGVFLAPPDTQFENEGKIENVTKGNNNVVREIFSNKRYSEKWLTLESKSKRESLEMLTSFNPDYSTQDSFIVNSCDIRIEELQNDTHTEYKATVRNCQDSKAISKYFMAYVRGQSGNFFSTNTQRI